MRVYPFVITPLATGNMNSNFSSAQMLNVGQYMGYAIQAVYTGSPVGTIKLQYSCDNLTPNLLSTGTASVLNANLVTNWTDVPNSSFAITGAGSFGWNYFGEYYSWVRVVYTYTSGSGNLYIQATVKD